MQTPLPADGSHTIVETKIEIVTTPSVIDNAPKDTPEEFSGIPFSDATGLIYGVARPVIDGVSHPYHGSLIDLDDTHFLMTFRYDTGFFQPHTGFPITKIGIVRLNAYLIQVGPTRFIDVGHDTAEDARLLKKGNAFWIAFNASQNAPNAKREMYIAQLEGLETETSVVTAKPIKLPFENSTHQKNWVPFIKDDKFYFGFSLTPHKILAFNETTSSVDLAFQVPDCEVAKLWRHGEMRGGTPGLPWDGEYLAFFHSRFYSAGLYWYTFGAYTFEAQAPHRITRLSKTPILFDDMYSSYANAIPGKKVIFPTGYVIRDYLIYLSFGENDSQIKILIMDLDRLRESLVPVNRPEI